MKKLSMCALPGGALLAVFGIALLLRTDPQPKPVPLFFPLLWDFAMVAIGTSCVFHCECARRAALIWSVFCVLASFAFGAAALQWLVAQPESPLSGHRIIFMLLTTGFGFIFAVWQLVTLRRPDAGAWQEAHASRPVHHPHHP